MQLVLHGLSSGFSCMAQSPAQLKSLDIFLDKNIDELNKIYVNLRQMSVAQEELYLPISIDCINAVRYSIDSVGRQTKIYPLMRDKQDKEIIRKITNIENSTAQKINEHCIEQINYVLPKIKSEVIMLELKQARDLLQKIQHELKRVSVPN